MSPTVYFVSGGNRGIGFALVQKLGSLDNSIVITTARNPEGATELNAWIKDHPNVHVLKYEATVHDDAAKLAHQIEKIAGGLDVFVANSGAGEDPKTVLETPTESWISLYNINVIGPIVLFKALYPLLLKHNTRKVLFVSSSLGSSGGMSAAVSASSYGQSKAALNFTAKELSLELAKENFIVVPLHPGLVSSELGSEYVKSLGAINGPEFEKAVSSGMITTEESASSITKLIQGLTPEDNGVFYQYDKTVLPW